MSTPIVRRRKKPVEVDTIQWTGSNVDDLIAFTGGDFLLVAPIEGTFAPDVTAKVFDELHDTWVGVKTGQHIVRGIQGEFYPIDETVLAETYEPVEEATSAAATATPDFFVPGHTYAREHHGDTIQFLVEHVSTSPDGRTQVAHGWRTRSWDPGWEPSDSDDFTIWVDVTEAGDNRG